jgi:hypothetical protein
MAADAAPVENSQNPWLAPLANRQHRAAQVCAQEIQEGIDPALQEFPRQSTELFRTIANSRVAGGLRLRARNLPGVITDRAPENSERPFPYPTQCRISAHSDTWKCVQPQDAREEKKLRGFPVPFEVLF